MLRFQSGKVDKSPFLVAVVVAEAEEDVADACFRGEANGVEAHCWKRRRLFSRGGVKDGYGEVPSVAGGECWVGLGCDEEEGISFRPTIHGKCPERGLR